MSDSTNVDLLSRLEADLDRALEARAAVWPRRNHPAYLRMQEAVEAYTSAVCAVAASEPAVSLTEELQVSARRFQYRPAFIVGAPKSGTTLVRNLLDGHPQLVVLPSEGQYWTSFLPRFGRFDHSRQVAAIARIWIERLINSTGQPPFWLLGRTEADGESPYANFIRYLEAWARHLKERSHGNVLFALILAFYTVTRDGAGRHVAPIGWVEKTPLNELHLGRILADFPEARFIHVVRDPRAIVAARKTINALQGLRRHPVLTDVHILRRSFARGTRNLQQLGSERYHVLRYEDLVHSPHDIIARLAEFLGIAESATLSEPTVAGMAASSNSAYARLRIPGRIYESSSRRYDEVLSPREQMVVRGILHRAARPFGYDLPLPTKVTLAGALAGAAVTTAPFYLRSLLARLRVVR